MDHNPALLYQARVQRILTTLDHREPDRVPVYFPTETWIASNAGMTVQKMIYDYGKLIGACEKVIEAYDWDAYWPPLGIWPAPIFDAVGQSQYLMAGEELEVGSTFQ